MSTYLVLKFSRLKFSIYFKNLVSCTHSTHWIRRKLQSAIKTLVFANRPGTRAWSTRLAIGYNPRLKIEVKINFWESYELNPISEAAIFIATLHFLIQPTYNFKKCATRSTKNIYLFLFTEAPSRPRRRGLPRASICNKEHGTY